MPELDIDHLLALADNGKVFSVDVLMDKIIITVPYHLFQGIGTIYSHSIDITNWLANNGKPTVIRPIAPDVGDTELTLGSDLVEVQHPAASRSRNDGKLPLQIRVLGAKSQHLTGRGQTIAALLGFLGGIVVGDVSAQVQEFNTDCILLVLGGQRTFSSVKSLSMWS